MTGKGSRRRPMFIAKEDYSKNWDSIFSKACENITLRLGSDTINVIKTAEGSYIYESKIFKNLENVRNYVEQEKFFS